MCNCFTDGEKTECSLHQGTWEKLQEIAFAETGSILKVGDWHLIPRFDIYAADLLTFLLNLCEQQKSKHREKLTGHRWDWPFGLVCVSFQCQVNTVQKYSLSCSAILKSCTAVYKNLDDKVKYPAGAEKTQQCQARISLGPVEGSQLLRGFPEESMCKPHRIEFSHTKGILTSEG